MALSALSTNNPQLSWLYNQSITIPFPISWALTKTIPHELLCTNENVPRPTWGLFHGFKFRPVTTWFKLTPWPQNKTPILDVIGVIFKNQLSYQVAKWSWSKISLRKSHSYPIHIPIFFPHFVHSEASDSMASNGHSSRFRRHQSRNQAAAESAATSGLGKSAEHRSSGKKHHVTPQQKHKKIIAFMGSLWKFIMILGYFFWIGYCSFLFFLGGCSRQRVGWWEPWYLLDWLNKQLTRNSLCFTESRTVRLIETILKQFRDTQKHTACWWNQYVLKLIIFVWEILCLESKLSPACGTVGWIPPRHHILDDTWLHSMLHSISR